MVSLAMCEPASVPYSLWESLLARGWQCNRAIHEHTGLWLGGTLQRHSLLWDELPHKISIYVLISAFVCVYELNEQVKCLNGNDVAFVVC